MKKYVFVASIALAVVVLDQVTKEYIREHLSLYDSIIVIDQFFQITHLQNPGAAFGLLADSHPSWRIPFFLAVGVVAVTALGLFVRRIEEDRWLLLASLGAILGGALGNLTDRVWRGAVTDFLDFHLNGYHWPAFNVADSGISIGMVILILYSLFAPEGMGETSS